MGRCGLKVRPVCFRACTGDFIANLIIRSFLWLAESERLQPHALLHLFLLYIDPLWPAL